MQQQLANPSHLLDPADSSPQAVHLGVIVELGDWVYAYLNLIWLVRLPSVQAPPAQQKKRLLVPQPEC